MLVEKQSEALCGIQQARLASSDSSLCYDAYVSVRKVRISPIERLEILKQIDKISDDLHLLRGS